MNIKNMLTSEIDFNDVKVFFYVATFLSFTKASEILYITQSSVSARIKRLEESFKYKLFVREKGRVTLTKEGEELLKVVEKFMDSMDTLQKRFTMKSQSLTMALTHGEFHKYSQFYRNFHKNYAFLFDEVSVTYGDLDENITNLYRGEIECFLSLKQVVQEGLISIAVDTFELALIGAQNFVQEEPFTLFYTDQHLLTLEEIKGLASEIKGEPTFVDITSSVSSHLQEIIESNHLNAVLLVSLEVMKRIPNSILIRTFPKVNVYFTFKSNLAEEKRRKFLSFAL